MRDHSGAVGDRCRVGRVAALTLVSLASVALLAGCSSADADQADAVPAVPSATPTASPGPTATPSPSLDREGSAGENLAFFNLTVKRVLAQDPSASGAALIDALAAAGFDRADMQVTPDRTTVDLEADSIQFAVRLNGECLIGQRGPEDGGYHSMVAPLLSTGWCLLGPAAK